MRPWEIKRLNRDEIFAYYLRPRKPKRPARPGPTYRQIFFAHGRQQGKPWLEIEGDWQRANAG